LARRSVELFRFPAMHLIRHWPEGLFILLVMLAPMGVAFGLSSSFWRFFVVLLTSMVCGFAIWIGTIVIATRIHEWRQRE
jgi:hypothetical protein